MQAGVHHGQDDHAQVANQRDQIDDEKQSKQWDLQLRAVCDAQQDEFIHCCEVVVLHSGIQEVLF